MDISRERKLNDAFASPLLNYINNKVMELNVSQLGFKHMSNDKEPILGDNKGNFTHLKTLNCYNYCNSTYIIFSSIYYKIMMVTEHKIIKILTSFSGKPCLFSKLVTPKVNL